MSENSNITSSKFSLGLEYALTWFFAIIACAITYNTFVEYYAYQLFPISEWMINYRGGFVRRGLSGEILWWLYQIHPYSIKVAVSLIVTVSFALLANYLYQIYSHYRWPYLPLLIFLAMPHIVVGHPVTLTVFRRDFLMLWLGGIAMLFLFKYLNKGRVKQLAGLSLLLSLSMLLHEPMFFTFVPITAFCLWYRGDSSLSKSKRLRELFIGAGIPTILMLIMSIYKGSFETSRQIWDSWIPLFEAYPEGETLPEIGYAVDFFRHSIWDVCEMHFRSNIQNWKLSTLLLWPIMFFGIYYATTRIPSIRHKRVRMLDFSDRVKVSNILIMQTIAMLPMFTVLSCDYVRTIPYCVISTHILFYLQERYAIPITYPRIITAISKRLQKGFDALPCFSSLWSYLIVLLITPMAWGGPLIETTPLWLINNAIKPLVHYLHNYLTDVPFYLQSSTPSPMGQKPLHLLAGFFRQTSVRGGVLAAESVRFCEFQPCCQRCLLL